MTEVEVNVEQFNAAMAAELQKRLPQKAEEYGFLADSWIYKISPLNQPYNKVYVRFSHLANEDDWRPRYIWWQVKKTFFTGWNFYYGDEEKKISVRPLNNKLEGKYSIVWGDSCCEAILDQVIAFIMVMVINDWKKICGGICKYEDKTYKEIKEIVDGIK